MNIIRSVPVACIFLTVAGLACGQTNSWHGRIVNKTKHPLSSFFSSCPRYVNVLVVDGRKFYNVRGTKRFYSSVPGTDTICFVTDQSDGTVMYHLFNMDNDDDVAIHAPSSEFGRSLGARNNSDKIEVAPNGNIILSSIDREARSTLPNLAELATVKWTCTLSASSRRVISQKTLYFDRHGKLLLEHDDQSP
jgi:hypothetical protein